MEGPTHAAKPHLKYRPDIDGLRAVAILLVLGFHAFPLRVPGGFVGVDVFFVISGYLISSVIVADLEADRFSLRRFYSRRILRIFPALLVVLAACFAIGWRELLANEFAQLGKHTAAASSFSANLVLWGEAGYFDTAAVLKPLLHLWSLGIEEQFYVVWPLLLWVAWVRRMNLLVVTAVLGAASFWFNLRSIQADAVGAFYSPFTRFWELLVGCALALTRAPDVRGAGVRARLSGNLKALIGVVLIGVAAVHLSSEMRFPGWWALPPATGALLLISAGDAAWINRRVLSQPLMVGIGLISYPLYLWHWPLFAFARIQGPPILSLSTRVGALLLSIVLAYSTYRFIERPVRGGAASTAGLLLVMMFVAGSVGFLTFKMNGFVTRFPVAVRAYANYAYPAGINARPLQCWLNETQPATDYAADCVDGPPRFNAALPLMFVWGDSHAARLYAGFDQVRHERYRLAEFARDSCPPLLGLTTGPCADANAFILERIQQTRPAVVVLFAYWKKYSPTWERDSIVATQLLTTISTLTRVGVPMIVVVGPSPTWDQPLPRLVYEVATRDPLRWSVPDRMTFGLDPSYARLETSFRSVLPTSAARYFSLSDLLCNQGGCLTHAGTGPDQIISWDYGHFTTPGAAYVAARLLPAIGFP